MDKYSTIITAKRCDNTIYIVENIISETAREAAYDKVKRLILQAAEKEKKPA